jgi:phosphohistidine phosphatase
MHIYLLRHGDALTDSRFHDNERPLSDLGKRQAAMVGTHLRNSHTAIDAIFASPLQRAQETAMIVHDLIGGPAIQTTDYLVNGTDLRQLCSLLAKSKGSSVLLVGHIPHLEDTILLFIGDQASSSVEMKKCTLAHIEITDPTKLGTGSLRKLTHVKELEPPKQ